MLKHALSLTAAVAVTAGSTGAVFTEVATQWGTIQPAGVRPYSSGHRFLNAQGTDAGANASDAYFRFDVSAAKADFDATYGAGNWFVTGVNVLLTQSNYFFTANGAVEISHFTDDTIAITSGQSGDGPGDDFSGLGTSPLVFGDYTNFSGNNVNFGTQTTAATGTFTETSTGDVDSYAVSGAGLTAVANDILNDDTISMVLLPIDSSVAATYKGNEFSGNLPPQLQITAAAIPEPATAGLLGLGVALASRRRR